MEWEPGSFRDPAGRIFYHDGRVFRTLSRRMLSLLEDLEKRGRLAEWAREGLLIGTEIRRAGEIGLPSESVGEIVLEHPRIPYVTYPYEWSFDMLRDAALLTLKLLRRTLACGIILKDATAFNIQFVGGRPVFIDVASFEPFDGDRPWTGYAQFCRSFLFPLVITSLTGVEFQSLLRGSLEGPTAQDAHRLIRWAVWRRPALWRHIHLQAALERRFGTSTTEIAEALKDVKHGRERTERLTSTLTRLIEGLRYRPAGGWTAYEPPGEGADAGSKRAFVEARLREVRGGRVVDLGCNTGEYAFMAAASGAEAVAADADAACVNEVYTRQKREGGGRVHPVVQDLADPSPSMGLCLRERKSWFERSQGHFFLALALTHHLALGRNIPLSSIIEMLAGLAPEGIVEFVSLDDARARALLALRPETTESYSQAAFERELSGRFQVLGRLPILGGHRTLYHVRLEREP